MAAKKWPKGQHRKQSSSNEQPSVQPSVKKRGQEKGYEKAAKQAAHNEILIAGAGLVTPQNSQALDLEDPASSFQVSTE